MCSIGEIIKLCQVHITDHWVVIKTDVLLTNDIYANV